MMGHHPAFYQSTRRCKIQSEYCPKPKTRWAAQITKMVGNNWNEKARNEDWWRSMREAFAHKQNFND